MQVAEFEAPADFVSARQRQSREYATFCFAIREQIDGLSLSLSLNQSINQSKRS